jgi:hypothetical protein
MTASLGGAGTGRPYAGSFTAQQPERISPAPDGSSVTGAPIVAVEVSLLSTDGGP